MSYRWFNSRPSVILIRFINIFIILFPAKKTKNIVSALKVPVPSMLQSNVVYQITYSQCKLSYVEQTSRHLQQRFKEHIGSHGLLKRHFEMCKVSQSFDMIKILEREKFEKSLILEVLFICVASFSYQTEYTFSQNWAESVF